MAGDRDARGANWCPAIDTGRTFSDTIDGARGAGAQKCLDRQPSDAYPN